jgi:hypothetical protein
MASNIDSLFLDPLSAQNSSQTRSNQPPSLLVNIWHHTCPRHDNRDKKYYCLYCKEDNPEKAPYGTNIALNIRKHYRDKYKTKIKPYISQI